MDDVITDLAEIERLADAQRDGDFGFRDFLKHRLRWSDRKLDSVVHEILRSVSSRIDCTQCANCCREMTPCLDGDDIARLARRLGMSADAFESVYVSRSEWGDQSITQMPCPFLEDGLCTVYEDRPSDCRSFPHLHKEDIRSRSIGFVENAAVCPIVFNTLRVLKQRLGWQC